jgi:hypothetical protein
MTLEVRQIVIRSTVGDAAAAPPPAASPGWQAPQGEWLQRLRQELLAQCRELLAEERRRASER